MGKEIDSVARTRADNAREVDLDLPEETDFAIRVNDVGHIWVNKTNFTAGTNTTLISKDLGAIRFTQDSGTTFVYQAGGVWREVGNGTRMLSPPEFAFRFNKSGRYPTLTLPIVSMTGEQRLDSGRVHIEKRATLSPLNDVSIVENDLVKLKVQSKWYVGWAKYFRNLIQNSGVPEDAAVIVDHQNNTATLKLIVPTTRAAIKGAIVSGASGGTLNISNKLTVDSYNSSKGPYSSNSKSSGGEVVLAGNLEMTNNPTINGNVTVGGNVTMQNSAKITGDLNYGGQNLSGGSLDPYVDAQLCTLK